MPLSLLVCPALPYRVTSSAGGNTLTFLASNLEVPLLKTETKFREKLIKTMELGSVASVLSVWERGRCSLLLQRTVPLTPGAAGGYIFRCDLSVLVI